MQLIQTDNALKPKGHYSQAVEHGGFIFISGILPFDITTGDFVEGTIEEQVKAVFENLDCILTASGTDYSKILKTTVYIPDIKLWSQINNLYSEYFREHRPARCIVPTGTLHYNSSIELEAIAYK